MRWWTASLLLAALGCSARQAEPVVTLERMPCLGSCPVYQVAIWEDGTVRFEGRAHVAHQGMAEATVPRERVDSLAAELEEAGYFGFAERYLHGEPACGPYAMDSPTVITSLSVGGRSRTIRDDYGCAAVPRELRRLERRIDEVAGSGRWTGR